VDAILFNIMKVQGVGAAGVFGPDDACLGFAASEQVFEPIMLLAAIRASEEVLDTYRTIEDLGDASSFSCELEHGTFVYRHVGGARLGVMALHGVNLSMLDVAVSVAVLKLQQPAPHRAGSSSAEYSAPQVARPMGLSMPSSMPSPPPMPLTSARPAGTSSGSSASNRYAQQAPAPPSLSSPTGRGPATGSQPQALSPTSLRSGVTGQLVDDWRPEELLANGFRLPGTIGPSVMQHVLRALSRFLGGHAKAVIVEELANLGATPATAKPEVFTDFIYNVAERIPDPGMHSEFVKLALGDGR
jgi:hypothetical protein